MWSRVREGLSMKKMTPRSGIRAPGELLNISTRQRIYLLTLLLQPGVFLHNQYSPHPDCMHSVHKIDDDIDSQEQHQAGEQDSECWAVHLPAEQEHRTAHRTYIRQPSTVCIEDAYIPVGNIVEYHTGLHLACFMKKVSPMPTAA